MTKIIKNRLGNTIVVFFIFLAIGVWFFSNLSEVPKVEALNASEGDGILFYGLSANTTPQWRTYNGATDSFGIQTATLAGAQPVITQARTSPTKQEAIAGYEDASGNLQIMCYDGTSWSNEWSLSVGGTGTTRRFDIAYETNSGDVVVLYSTNVGTTNELAYRTKSGALGCGSVNWSSATMLNPARTSGVVQWVKMARNPLTASNLIAAIWADANSDLSAMVWSGAAWGNEPAAVLEANLERVSVSQDVDNFEIVYESLSGDIMAAWGTTGSGASNLVKYATCPGNSSSCTWSAVGNVPTVADAATNLDLSVNPLGNQIAISTIDNGTNDLSAAYWSGTAWTGYANLDTSTESPLAGMRLTQTGWLTSGATTRWIITYDDATGSGLSWYAVAPGSSPVKQTDWATTPAINDIRERYDLENDPFNSNKLMLLVSDSTRSIFTKQLVMDSTPNFTWSNSDGGASLGTTNNVPQQGFSFRYWQYVPVSTILGNGADPANSTVAPGSPAQYVDQFTFITSGGTDSVTALTVTTANTAAIASLQIWNEAMTTQYFGTLFSPIGDNWSFSGGTAIPVSTSGASFRVVFIPKGHTVLSNGDYPVTAVVSAFTSTNAQSGSDSGSATITVENSPPADATWGTITPSDGQIVLNWTNPGTDFNKVVVLRKIGSSITDAPADGLEYNISDTIGSSVVRYVNNGTTFTDTGLSNGTDYYYKIFSYDNYINYASGVGTGPHTPNPAGVITVGATGSQVFTITIPLADNYIGGAFTFTRNIGSDNVTQIIITETGTVDANANLSNVKLYYDTLNCTYEGTESQFGTTGSFNSSEKATFTGSMAVGTSQVCLYVVLDVGSGAQNGDILDIEINAVGDITSLDSTISASSWPVVIGGSTNLQIISADPATWRAAEDTLASASAGSNIRLRIQITNTGAATTADYRLQYAQKTGPSCGDDESFSNVPVTATIQPFEMVVSDYEAFGVADGDPTTAKLTGPLCCSFSAGRIVADPSNSSGSFSSGLNKYTEFEFVLKILAGASGSYCFKAVNIANGEKDLDEYSVQPELLIP